MKIIDMHIHMGYVKENQTDILENMEKVGVYGGCIFSAPPKEHRSFGKDFEERLCDVLKFTEGNRDRLFPILWVHPDEENIIEKIEIAVKQGIDGFKMICNNFYVYEEKSLAMIKKMAELNKPVFFHSGILWDGTESSDYNRPMNWEKLINIKGLRFSMGHCSWPWYDECIALYGKFLNALIYKDTAEMFLDLTPGTPEIYRKDLLYKLFMIGYDVENNIMFGTDCHSEDYNSSWCEKWLEADREIMDELGISKRVRENLYFNNIMRFLGKTNTKIQLKSPDTDNSNSSDMRADTKDIIIKWYEKIGFNKCHDKAFYKAVNSYHISDAITVEKYNPDEKDGMRNLLSYLYFCEALKEKYDAMGISEEIFYDTVKDISIWTDSWSEVKGETYLGELSWLNNHFNMKLFKLGRLQFMMDESAYDIPSRGIKKGDNVLEVHIPKAGALTPSECEKSFEASKGFFSKYFPQFKFTCYTCHCWMLSKKLKEFLPQESNIVKFMEMFDVVEEHLSDAILTYVFKWNTNRTNLAAICPSSGFATEVKKRALKGEEFYVGLGVIDK